MGKCAVCSDIATQTCSRCKDEAYCGKEHQIQHWKLHKLKCNIFKIQTCPDLGKYLVTSHDVQVGTKLISEGFLVLGPKTSTDPVCLGCYKPVDPETSPKCLSCLWPVCDVKCSGLFMQEHHLPECIVLSKNLQPAMMGQLNYDAILPLRCLLLQKTYPKRWMHITSLESHISQRDETTDIYKDIEEKISSYLKDFYLSFLDAGVIPDTSSGIIHYLCGIIEVNAIEITTSEGEIMAVYPNACLMEHSCLPNVKYSFDLQNFKIIVEASEDIKKGEHICTMYTHMLWGTKPRQQHLLTSKYFQCKCTRCTDPTELGTNFSTLKCISSSTEDVGELCNGLVMANNSSDNSDWSCNKCPLVLSSEHVTDLLSMIGALVDKTMEDPTIDDLEKLVTKMKKLLHENHYHCFTVEHSLIQLWGRKEGYMHQQMTNSLLNKKIETCRRLASILRKLDPKGVRTSLYLSVCVLEESLALSEESRRVEDVTCKQKILTQAQQVLENVKNVLDDSGPSQKLKSIIHMSHYDISNQLNKYKYSKLVKNSM